MKYALSLIFGLAIAFPVPAALSSVSGENQDVIYRLLYSKAFFQSYEAQNQLRKMRLANEREEADEKDFGEVVRDLLGDEGIRSFFATALRKKVERAH